MKAKSIQLAVLILLVGVTPLPVSSFGGKPDQGEPPVRTKPISGPPEYDTPIRSIDIAKPIYPELAAWAGIEGTVVVRAQVDVDGRVSWVETLKSLDGGCEQAVVKAMKTSRFSPAKVNGRPIRAWFICPVEFRIPDLERELRHSVQVHMPRPLFPDSCDVHPEPLEFVKPRYPEIAIEARIEGKVVVKARVDAHGTVSKVHVLRSLNEALDGEAVRAARVCRFSPAKLGGKPIEVWMIWQVTYSLRELPGDGKRLVSIGELSPLVPERCDAPPKAIGQLTPDYPEAAVNKEIEGMVVLAVLVGVSGAVKDANVLLSLSPECDRAALDAVSSTRFAPAREGDQPVEIWVAYPVRFVLTESHPFWVRYRATLPEAAKQIGLDSLKISLRAEKRRYRIDEPISLFYTLQNAGEEPLLLVKYVGGPDELRRYPHYEMDVLREDGSRVQRRRFPVCGMHRLTHLRKRDFFTLEPGEIIDRLEQEGVQYPKPPHSDYNMDKPGQYRITLIYRQTPERGTSSNTIDIEICDRVK